MSNDEIDIMWQQAMHQSIEDGEMFTRYHFAKLVAAKEREACAKVCELESGDGPDNGCCPTFWNEAQEACAAAIRARGEA